ncbi:MAG: LysR family transcriptional regulator [Acidimicrobiales bacterium]
MAAAPPASWSSLELRHLAALVAVAEVGTFGRAATALGYTQSAVSQQVAALEKAVGAPVFDRPGGPRPVRLTPVGQVLLDHARTVLGTLRAAAADVEALTSGERGQLRVGTIQSVGTQVLPRLLTHLRAERPGMEIVLQENHDPNVLLGLVESQDLDITFCSHAMGDDATFEHRLVLEDPFVLLAPATPEWIGRSTISLEEIVELPLIGNRNPACSAAPLLALEEPGANFVFHSDDNSTIQGCVAAGLGVSLSPLLTIDLDDPTTTIVTVDPPIAPRLVGIAWARDRRPSALLDAFVAATEVVCQEVAAAWAAEAAA